MTSAPSGSNSGKGSGTNAGDDDLPTIPERPTEGSPSTTEGSISVGPAATVTASPTTKPQTTGATIASGRESRIIRTTKCGSTTFRVEIRVTDKELRVRTSLSPRSDTGWMATLLQDRRIIWRGAARRGEVDRKLAKLVGSEVVTIRMASSTGAICAAELAVPG